MINRLRIVQIILFSLFHLQVTAQPKTDHYLLQILAKNQHSIFKSVLQNKDKHRLQIIYTEINRDRFNKPSFTNHYFNYDPYLYFNPASTVKMPLAFLSLEKLNEMKLKGVNKYTSIQFDSSYKGQTTAYEDNTSANGKPSIAHYIKKAFLISDNDAYNRMYQFLGQQTINQKFAEKGYINSKITRQFMAFTEEQNRNTNPLRFIDEKGKTIYSQPAAYNTNNFDFSREIKLGKSHLNSKDSLVQGPFDFTKHNNISLEDYQQMLQSVLFPSSVTAKQRFNFSKDDEQFLLQFLSQYPSETNYPKYDTGQYYDSYVKFFFRDESHKMPENVRVFNKVGWAYGFMTDVAYVADFKNKVEFMLAATVYVNEDEILNDGKYEYETVGSPFMYQLGQTIYKHELDRFRQFKPDLSHFKIRYEKRDANDKRPSIKDAVN